MLRRIVMMLLTVAAVTGMMGYASGYFTGEVRREDSCVLCRATRYTGVQYGVAYTRIEDGPVTRWFRATVDPLHGRSPSHPHEWHQSACTVVTRPGFQDATYGCVAIPSIFLLRPEIEVEVLDRIPDLPTKVAVLRSLNSPDRRANARRVRRLIEYHYVDREEMPWGTWWARNAAQFGVDPASGAGGGPA
ncbi:MAG: hypothetical protein IT208_14315 [Chthonomonadales bacterium]|nr:hypothetical protein [Chthonomonadales bacterium]